MGNTPIFADTNSTYITISHMKGLFLTITLLAAGCCMSGQTQMHYPLLPSFDVPDPLSQDYPSLSPYSHCAGNPLSLIDPTGMDWIAAKYNDDQFLYYEDDIKSQNDIYQKYGSECKLYYFGNEVAITSISPDGNVSDRFCLLPDGRIFLNDKEIVTEYNNHNLHIGKESLASKSSLHDNWYGFYLGPNNPKNSDGLDLYAVPPMDYLDYAAYQHDNDYAKVGAEGPFDALFSTATITADLKFAIRCMTYEPPSSLKGLLWNFAAHKTFTNIFSLN